MTLVPGYNEKVIGLRVSLRKAVPVRRQENQATIIRF
jgi:hypothetical protein